jgi:hypothetical protein
MGKEQRREKMTYIHDDYWSAEWRQEAEYEYDFAEQQRIELQNASGVDMPNLGRYRDWIDFSGCISFPEVVPF